MQEKKRQQNIVHSIVSYIVPAGSIPVQNSKCIKPDPIQ